MGSKSSKSKHRGGKSVKKKKNNTHYHPRKSSLKPNLLVQKATISTDDLYHSDRTYQDFPLDERFKTNLLKKGYIRPTEIQDKTFDALIEKKDVVGVAQTGTGKTGAYLIPIIERSLRLKRKPFALIVVPTRELALQIDNEFRSITKGLKLYSSCFIGGTNINKDIQALRRPAHVMIGTPRRILELIKHRELDIRETNTLVLDEFDKMLSLGFLKEVEHITGAMHRRQHTLLFSATVNAKIQPLIDEILYQPLVVKLKKQNAAINHIEQDVIELTPEQNQFDILTQLLEKEQGQKVLIFDETKAGVEALAEQLVNKAYNVSYLHGDLDQKNRTTQIKNFAQNNTNILIATDIAARGIDISEISLVINYQIPQNFEQYTHRIGRTGRAGKQGKAYTFIKKK
ncbi:MAG: DEAD/DEAH box helicase [Flavobacteriales bacterium]|jgi:ATP-dependent RNA helicase RhlE|nr:DEAD/DEAH box helicase [Flavobacteriales bacterium]